MITPQTAVNYQFFHGALHIVMGWLFLYSSLLSLHRVRSCDPRNLKAWAQNSLSDVGVFFCSIRQIPPNKRSCNTQVMKPTSLFAGAKMFFCLMVSTQSQNILWDISPKGSRWTSNRLLPSDISLKVIFKNQQVVIWFLWTLWFQTATFQPLKGNGQYHGTILVPEYIMHQFKHPKLFGQSPGKCLFPTHTPFRKKNWFRGAKSPRRKPAQKPVKSRTRDHQKAQGQQQSASGRGHGLAWMGSPLFFSSKKKRAAGPPFPWSWFQWKVWRFCKSLLERLKM